MARAEALLPHSPAGVPRLIRLAIGYSELPAAPTSVLEVALYRILG